MNVAVYRPKIETERQGNTYRHMKTWEFVGVGMTFRERFKLAWLVFWREADVLLPWYMDCPCPRRNCGHIVPDRPWPRK